MNVNMKHLHGGSARRCFLTKAFLHNLENISKVSEQHFCHHLTQYRIIVLEKVHNFCLSANHNPE